MFIHTLDASYYNTDRTTRVLEKFAAAAPRHAHCIIYLCTTIMYRPIRTGPKKARCSCDAVLVAIVIYYYITNAHVRRLHNYDTTEMYTVKYNIYSYYIIFTLP